MTRNEKLAEIGRLLTEQQVDDVLAMARHNAMPASVFDTLSADEQARLIRIRDRAAQGEGLKDGRDALASLDARLKAQGV
ncbi:MAG: hypothetical protein ACR2O4_01065 [Hyphomicrobiaceae bacterium]